MTVGEVIKELEKYDKDTEVGGSGYFGELLEIYSIYKHDREGYVCINIERAGDEPN
jgi:hypothetical protein